MPHSPPQAPDALPEAGALSLPDIRHRLQDLFAPRPFVYWTDFLLTIAAGHACFALVRRLSALWPSAGGWWLQVAAQAAAFLLACVLYYRAAMFIHELAHLPKRGFRVFRIVWNLLCGIPFLMPSFLYDTHVDHHRRRSYGTHHDGEYLALAELRPWHVALYWTQGLYGPLLAAARFLVLAPLSWLNPSVRKWVHEHASSLVVDPSYVRPQARRGPWAIWLEEAGCFAWCCGVLVAVVGWGKWPYPFLLQVYATGAVVISLNAIRTAAAHRWRGDRQRVMSTQAQVLDSVTIGSDSLLAVIISPVGLRYHALHHMFPSLPYHNLREAHRRLMAQLAPDSPYRATVEPSVIAAVAKLRPGST